MYKLCFYVPEGDLEVVKNAVFDVGAGRVGNYDRCSWDVLGRGQFRPLSGSNPHLGSEGEIETVLEYKVEMVCADELVDAAVAALRKAHPYEEPAFDLWQLGS